jgi:L-iditol 2-dehydrogenase
MVQLARLAGAGKIVLSTRQPARRKLTERLGSTATIDPNISDPIAAARDVVAGGVDVVLECAGGCG